VPKIRIVLADDHQTIREGLKLLINGQADMEVVGEADDGVAAVQRAQETLPDVVVMDVSMPSLNGLQATSRLKACCPQVQVLALTRHSDDGYLQELLRAGVSGYVLKQSHSSELLGGIRAVATGGKYLDPAIAGKALRRLHRPSRVLSNARQAAILSPREEEVVRFIAWGYSNKEIAERLDLSVKTVETHKANAMEKLGMRSRIDVVRFAIMKGWLTDA
jgi:DNA-binding NarL/FixJ family response regulator